MTTLTAGLLARGLLVSVPSQDLRSQWFVAELTPLTVAGAATASGNLALTAFPFDPRRGTVMQTLGRRTERVNKLRPHVVLR